MSAPRSAMGKSNINSNTSLELAYAMADAAQRLNDFPEIDQFKKTGHLPDAFFACLEEFYALSDRYVHHNTIEARMAITCKPDCDRCCNQPVRGIYSFEIINIYRKIRTLKSFDSIHRDLTQRASAFSDTIKELVKSGKKATTKNGSHEDMAQEKLMQTAYPCPFLKNHSCMVYADRPIVCRIFHSVTEPALCTTAQGVNFSIDYPPVILESLHQLHERLGFMRYDDLARSMIDFIDGHKKADVLVRAVGSEQKKQKEQKTRRQ